MAMSSFSSSFGLKSIQSLPTVIIPGDPIPSLSVTSITPPSGYTGCECFNISSDGTSIIFINGNQNVWLSFDCGVTWNEKMRLWAGGKKACISNSGKDSIILLTNLTIAISNDWGQNYNHVNVATGAAGATNWYDISMSDDGKYICLAGYNQKIYLHNNYGIGNYATWRKVTQLTTTNFYVCSMSKNGKYISASVSSAWNSECWYSSDYGVLGSFKKITTTIYGGFYTPSEFTILLTASGVSISKTIENTIAGLFTLQNTTLINSTNSNNIVTNLSGSTIYFIGLNNKDIYISTDYLKTATIFTTMTTLTLGIKYSENTQFMLVWDGTLKVLKTTYVL